MKSNRENRNTIDIILLAILCWSSSIIAVEQILFSFDSLFPATWYQKGLESSLSAWQHLVTACEKNRDITASFFDILLARLCFTQFCIDRIKQSKLKCLPEDIAYFSVALKKIKGLIKMIVVTERNEDFVLCVQEMVANVQRQIVQLP